MSGTAHARPARYGRPGTKAAKLREAVYDLLVEHDRRGEIPTSNRFLFYELAQAGVLDKSRTRAKGRGADQDLSHACKWLRDKGLVPWTAIVDETRSLSTYLYAETVADYLLEEVEHARLDVWGGAPPPLIICESRTFGGVLDRTLGARYLTPITATGGQVGGFLHTNVAPILEGNERPVLYVGDLEPDGPGRDIEVNTRSVLFAAAGERDWTRVALTPEQAAGMIAVEKVDRRFRPPKPYMAVEVEALGQSVVTGIVQEALEALLPEPLEDALARERAEVVRWRRLLGELADQEGGRP